MALSDDYVVKPITREQCKHFFLNVHYAKRMPGVSYAFGCFEKINDGEKLIGVVSYGSTANNNLNKWGDFKLIELNRLCFVKSIKNLSSFFVSKTFSLLPSPVIVISYADSTWNHHGYIYQSLNFIYCGVSKGDIEFKIGDRQYHRKRMFDLYGTGSVKKLKELCPEATAHYQGDKYRYLMAIGNKTERKAIVKEIAKRYKTKPYPKGDNQRYQIVEQDLIKKENEIEVSA